MKKNSEISQHRTLRMWLTSLRSLHVRHAGDNVSGEIQLVGATKVVKTSSVWIDGQYVGYLKELKESKKVLVLPGEHEIVVRQAGYRDFAQEFGVQPRGKQVIQRVSRPV